MAKRPARRLTLILALCAAAVSCHDRRAGEDVFTEVDREIRNNEIYQTEKEKRIGMLRDRLHGASDSRQRLEATDGLIDEYEAYVSDSALYYVALGLQNPVVTASPYLTRSYQIRRADILSHAGLFNEAEQALEAIPAEELDSTLREKYYAAFAGLYQYQSEYAEHTEFSETIERLREAYVDSVIRYSDPATTDYIVNSAAALTRQGDYAGAIMELESRMGNFKPGDREYSILASLMAHVYERKGDRDNQRRYLAMSAASDLKGAVKENMAMRALATLCFEDGDLERANKYLKQSFADANFYSARMRNAQSSRMLPVIDEAYQERQQQHQKSQRGYLVTVSLLAVVLLAALWVLFKQNSKVRKVNLQKQQTLDELELLSGRLKEVNGELETANSDLRKANIIKEEYAGLFMEYCSLAISGLQQYHRQLRLLAVQGNVGAILKRLDSSDVTNKTLHEFYAKFDEAILSIYPSFVEKVNALLKPGEQIIMKHGEKLNTELRLLALIRIGISDPEKIAQFLRCSLSTVYTYRSKLKKRAQDPENFLEDFKL